MHAERLCIFRPGTAHRRLLVTIHSWHKLDLAANRFTTPSARKLSDTAVGDAGRVLVPSWQLSRTRQITSQAASPVGGPEGAEASRRFNLGDTDRIKFRPVSR